MPDNNAVFPRRALLLKLRLILLIILGLSAVVAHDKALARGLAAAQGAIAAQSAAPAGSAQQDRAAGYVLPPQLYARAVRYSREGYWLYFVTTVCTILILWLLIRWKTAPWLRNWAERITCRRWLQFVLFGPTLLLIFGILLLPTAAWDQWRMRRFGMSVQGWGAWLGDWTTSEIATALGGAVAIGLLYYMIRRSPRRWWLFLWALALPLVVLLVFIQPVAIDPLFETLEPLSISHPDLADSIEVLAGRGGLSISPQHIYLLKTDGNSAEADASSEGFGPTKSVFVMDSLIASGPRAAVLHEVGHEIGHFMFTLDWIVFAICVPLSLVLLYFIHRSFVWALGRWGAQWNIRGPDDWASLPVLAFIVSLILIIFTPAANTLSRYREHEADRHGLDLVDGIVPNVREAGARAFQEYGEANLADPDPPAFIEWWLFDHPPVNERIIFCRTYRPLTSLENAEPGK